MCVCVLEILVLKYFWIERFFFKICVDWIIGWVVCWIAFISVFFTSRKTGFKSWLDTSSIPCYLSSFSSIFLNTILTPPRYLVDHRESSCILDSSSTPAGSNELLFLTLILCCSIASSIPWLSKTRSSIPTLTDPSIPLDTCICWDLLAAYIRPLCDPEFISLRSLSLYFSVSLPKHSHLTPNSLLGKLLILSHSCISWFKT